MKLIIAGGRDYHLTPADIVRLDELRPKVREVVCGGCSGADLDGELWAARHGIAVAYFPAHWQDHGRSAGPKRNAAMAAYADAVALFPGGKGTESMAKEAERAGIQVFDFREPESNG
jgi:hypothetical protein